MFVGFFLFKFMLTYDFIQCIPDFVFAKLLLVATCVSATNIIQKEKEKKQINYSGLQITFRRKDKRA